MMRHGTLAGGRDMDHLIDETTGFPYLVPRDIGLAVGALPVTKVEYEFFFGDPAGTGGVAYSSALAVNPRASWRGPTAGSWEGLFVTGVTADEAAGFAAWLGGGTRLPTASEWRAADRTLAAVPADVTRIIADPRLHPAAASVLTRSAGRGAVTWREAGLFAGGLLEWVSVSSGFGLYGRPRPDLYRLLLDPQVHDPPRPRTADRHRAFGFRLVRPLALHGDLTCPSP